MSGDLTGLLRLRTDVEPLSIQDSGEGYTRLVFSVATIQPSGIEVVAVESFEGEISAGLFVLDAAAPEALRSWLDAVLGDPEREDPGEAIMAPKLDEHFPAEPYGRCRAMLPKRWPRRACGLPSVASYVRGTRRPQRWGYCERHLWVYGRVLRQGPGGPEVWWDPREAERLRGLP